MTEKQKQAIKILNELRWDTVINENDYFLLLEFIVSDTRNEVTISEYPWNIPKSPNMPIAVMYGCSTDVISYSSSNTCNKIEEEQQ